MPTCKIQWVDPATGNPTPDHNEAAGYAFAFNAAQFEWFPICAEHLARMPRTGWVFVRAEEATPEKLDAHLAEISVVVDAIKNAFPKVWHEILPALRHHPGDGFYSFVKWGMFVGVEKDGYIHT